MIRTEEMFHIGIPTFMGSDYVDLKKIRDYDVAAIGIPLDHCSSYRQGARYAPKKIREYSSWDRVDGTEYYDYDTKTCMKSNHLKICDVGDINIWPGNSENNQIETMKSVKEIRKKTFPIIIGGDHSITYGSYIGCKKGYNSENIGILHFDAHNDLEESCLNLPKVWHGNVFRKLIEEKHVSSSNMLSIGIRGLVDKKWHDYVVDNKIGIITSEEANKNTAKCTIKKVTDFFNGLDGVYVSFDMDCLDPTICQGTGVLKYNGLETKKTIEIIRLLKKLNIIGFDLVEFNPEYDKNGSTCIIACEILYNFLAFSFGGRL